MQESVFNEMTHSVQVFVVFALHFAILSRWHQRAVQTSTAQAYKPSVIKRYFEGGESPYGENKKYPTTQPEKNK
jgi:hypothetical protein